jgi:hypothetical protein
MSSRREETKLRQGPSHTYIVRFPADQPAPLTVQADSFEAEADAVTFTTDGNVSAVVRGSWVSVVQQPDVVLGTGEANG